MFEILLWELSTMLRHFDRHVNKLRRAQGFQRKLVLETLENRQLLSTTSFIDDPNLDDHGADFDYLPAPDETLINSGTGIDDLGAPVDVASTFFLHSNRNAQHTIYLDFTGHVTSGTVWNSSFTGGADITTPVFDLDGNPTTFSTTELTRIQYIWQRVAEDFAPFNVDVTTEAPADVGDLMKSGSGDTRWGLRVAIGGSSYDWYGNSAGGVGYVGSFSYNSDTPVFVFTAQLGGGAEKYTAEAISHETGHALGLSHDGTSTTAYFAGQGSWAPIMGNSYYNNVTQWSLGEYSGATNKQDDLAVLTTNNGFSYRADDYGNTLSTAGTLSQSNTTVTASGIIERNTDADVFAFLTGDGLVTLNITPAYRGPNLDILAQLYDASNTLIATSNSSSLLSASFSLALTAGQYFLRISGTGSGDPLTTGYSSYASLGQYWISGTVVANTTDRFMSIAATNAVRAEGSSSSTSYTFTVTRSGNTSQAASVNWSVAGSGSNQATASDFLGSVLPSGTLSFLAGESSKVLTVSVVGDTQVESDEGFTVTLSNASAPTQILHGGTASGTIQNDDSPPAAPSLSIAALDARKNEGNSASTLFTFRVTRSGDLSATSSARYQVAGAGGSAAASSDFAGGTLPGGTVSFAAGQSTATIQVLVQGDTGVEKDEQFRVTLSSTVGATLGTSSATGTILNDDAATRGAKKTSVKRGEVVGEQPETSWLELSFRGTKTRSTDNSSPQADVRLSGQGSALSNRELLFARLATNPLEGLESVLDSMVSLKGQNRGSNHAVSDAIFHSPGFNNQAALGEMEVDLG